MRLSANELIKCRYANTIYTKIAYNNITIYIDVYNSTYQICGLTDYKLTNSIFKAMKLWEIRSFGVLNCQVIA
ncbi:hypothetical protein EB796_006799 [Bugula neritina]|uniref:Uncharacterized protein n=1 Tax=Bugula neritina TaxID=10212 RepID=A0A7J7KBA0_BUGNE|nr:hypothetical protein EB796_006799 [Bugula neritina]